MSDTIAAHSSGRPPAAIAVIRTSGPMAVAVGTALCGSLPKPREAALRTLRDPATGDPIDTALVLRFAAPHSATGEDIVEYQCHGGRAVVAAVLDAVTSWPHVRLAEPGEFTRRALANGRIDLTEAEGLADLLEAETEAQRRAALALAGGALSRQVEAWQARVLDLSARAEAAIDYVGDEDETATDTAGLRLEAQMLAGELDAWLARPRAELLKDGIRVVIAGPPNAGKSSLINALSRSDRAIVTAIPGTTRDAIEVPIALEGMAFVLVDTAGLRETIDPVEAIGVARARVEADRAEILLWLGDAGEAPAHPNLIRLLSKCDLLVAVESADPLHISTVTGQNLPELLERLVAIGRGLMPVDGQLVLNARQAEAVTVAAEALACPADDLLLIAESLRAARSAFDRVTGRAGVEDAIDAVFSRFCLGK